MRNRLTGLQTQVEFAFQKDPDFHPTPMEEAFLQMTAEANAAWTELKRGS